MKKKNLRTRLLIVLITFAMIIPAYSISAVTLVPDSRAPEYMVPDYFGAANWANSPQLTKFIDELPGLGSANQNLLGQYIPVAVADTQTYPNNDYYEIAVVEYEEKMHSELAPTRLRGYVQISTTRVPGLHVALTNPDGSPILLPNGAQAYGVDKPHYLGPAIISTKNRATRVKFYNLLPKGVNGNLFIPVDKSVMGAGMGSVMGEEYTQNRSNMHMHGNNTVWISDGTPHQWITPADETTSYPQGVSVYDVPDMGATTPTDGTTTLYYTNAQSARLLWYHDHSYGITRLNVYVGEAAPYILMDDVEKDLINGTNVSGVNPLGKKYLPDVGIPLIIQDKAYVDTATIMTDDPAWAWGTTPGTPHAGDLWYPHVYEPAQNPWAEDGTNPFGRWMYGPWFYPPTTTIPNMPIANPYYDPINAPWQPPMIPGTPSVSAPGESFMDTPVINGTAYPYMDVDPKTYRFRILNAANDRFFNLQMYVADDTYLPGTPGYLTEVKMIPAPADAAIPSHLAQFIPDPLTQGPDWIQIGSEGGFLPAPAVIPSIPTSWRLGLTAFNAGTVDRHSLLIGTAERADVLVDFSQFAGKTLIVYNDAPAPFPANDPRYDYFTNDPDQTEIGGAPTTLPGKGPNTRTIMQIRVSNTTPAAAYDLAALNAVFTKTATNPGVFSTGQEPIIIPQAAYNTAYNANYPADAASAFVQIDEFDKTFTPITKQGVLLTPVTLPFEPKAMHDEMGGVYDEYGRMAGFLGLTSPKQSSIGAPFIPYGFASPPVDIIKSTKDIETTQIGSLEDGTQIWKITHNGVDTHTIHTHLFDSQLVNRVAWDGFMMPPDANELGWKDTIRVNPLEHTIIAMRPKAPTAAQVPFDVPNSVRLIDPTMAEGAVLTEPPMGWFDTMGNPVNATVNPVTGATNPDPRLIINHYVNYGWEYVWHCHILSHEEMDMMHVTSFVIPPKKPTNLAAKVVGTGTSKKNVLTWVDNTLNETGYVVQRSTSSSGPWTTLVTVPQNINTYSDPIGNVTTAYYYQVIATNVVGDVKTPGFPSVTMNSDASNFASAGSTPAVKPATPTNLTATLSGTQAVLSWKDNANNETSYIIQRSANNGVTFANLITLGAQAGTNIVTYTDTTSLAGIAYRYRVAARNTAGTSSYSNIATLLPPSSPLAPSNVAVTVAVISARYDSVKLTWLDRATNETAYVIESATNLAFTINLTSTTIAANSTTHTTAPNLVRATNYYFRIRAINATGQSVWVSATPLPYRLP